MVAVLFAVWYSVLFRYLVITVIYLKALTEDER